VRHTGLPILAVRSSRQEGFAYNPSPETPIAPGHVLVVMGEVDRVKKLEELVKAEQHGTFLNPGTQRILPPKPEEAKPAAPAAPPASPAPAPQVVRASGDDLKDPRDNL